ncbi:peptide ABC transporter substrate-binding protein [Falsibacillus pallidus]|uniref:Oligopeptide transport system substrate-binding protein n=1 Tax=Falsibacillus pallidus TaxID=493781 RepID=A0A370GWZ3_9BACI|nr:peptide ABC transporter substrate-binding protein [Falsibacillus pallidus]RDI47770.1 oligopeptide transport system substrate-binding protein [Falsibacillus pallidus]
MKKSKLLLLLCFSLVLSMFLSACYGKDEEKASNEGSKGDTGTKTKTEQVLNTYETAEIPTMNTIMAQDAVSLNVMNQVFEGLMRLDKDNKPTLGMAAEEPQKNEDGTVYTFKIRDAKWSNGTPVTANDFVYAWQQTIDPKNATPYGAYMMGGVIKNAAEIGEGKMAPDQLGVKAIDDKTLEVTLERPVPYFLSLMTFPIFYPQNQEFVESKGDQYATNSDNMIYNGPFTLSDWNGTGLSWKYKKNDSYWDKDTVQLTQVNVNVVKETGTAVNLYKTGKVDRAALSAEYVTQYENDPDLNKYLEPTIFWFKFNQERTGKKTALANKNIRMALSLAVDKQSMVDTVLANGSVVANYEVPKEFAFNPESGDDFRKGNGDMNEYNLDKAKEYWKKGLEELGTDKLDLEILGGDSEVSKNMDAYFKNQLEKNLEGLSIKLKEVPFKIRLDLDTKQDYDIQVAGWGPDYQDPMTFSDLFVTGGSQNKMGYSNPEYDKLISDAKTTLATDPQARWEALQKAEKILMDDAAISPLYQRAKAVLQQKYVKDLYVHPFGPEFSYKWTHIEK